MMLSRHYACRSIFPDLVYVADFAFIIQVEWFVIYITMGVFAHLLYTIN